MSDESFVREKVRALIQAGRLPGTLPDRTPDHVWGGPGTGVDCAICGDAITRGEMELEVEFTGEHRGDAESYLVHLHCFCILENERQNKPKAGVSLQATGTESTQGHERVNGS